MECFHTLFSILTCGLCGSPRHDDGHTKPLLSDTDASRADRYPISTSGRFPPQPRAKKPVNTSNMLGLGIRDVNADYELGELVGEGAFGTVHRCVNRRSGQQYACKTVVKSQLKRRADVEDVRREVQILMVCCCCSYFCFYPYCYLSTSNKSSKTHTYTYIHTDAEFSSQCCCTTSHLRR